MLSLLTHYLRLHSTESLLTMTDQYTTKWNPTYLHLFLNLTRFLSSLVVLRAWYMSLTMYISAAHLGMQQLHHGCSLTMLRKAVVSLPVPS